MSVDIAQLGIRVDSIEADIAAGRLKKLGKAANEAETAAMRLAKQYDKVGRSMKKAGRNMSMYVTAPLLAAAAASIKFGTDFEHNLTKIITLVGVSRGGVAKFRKEILKISPALARGPVELSNALFAVTSAGQRGTEAMDTLTAAAKASTIGLGDTRTIALAVTAAIQAYGKSNMDASRAVEILIGTIEQGNLAAEDLAPVLGRAIGLAAELGVAFEDMGAFIAVYTRLGVSADESATALRSSLASLQKPAQDAEAAFVKMGTSLAEVREKIAGGPGEFIKTMQDLIRRSREFNVELVNIFPNVRAAAGMLGVFGGEGEVALDVVDKISAAIGTLEERLQAVKDLDPQFAFDEMKASLEGMAIAISNDLLPAVISIAEEISDFGDGFRELSPETQKMIIRMALLVAAIGPLLIVFGSLVSTLGTLVPLIVLKLIPALALMGGAFLPGAALLVGIGLLATLFLIDIPDGVEESISVTEEFQKSLEELIRTLDAVGLKKDVTAIDVAILKNLRDQLEVQADLMSRSPLLSSHDRMEQLERELALMIQQREEAEIQLHFMTKHKVDPMVAAEFKAAIQYFEAVMKARGDLSYLLEPLGEDDAKSLAKLIDKLEPAAAKMRKLAEHRALLARAFGAKDGLSPERYEELTAALKKLIPTFNTATDTLGEFRQMNQGIADELQRSFAFMETLEFNLMAEGMQAEIDALNGGAEAWKQYQKAMFQAQKVAEAGKGKTAEEIQEIERLAGVLFDATDAFNNMGDEIATVGDKLIDAAHIAGTVFSAAIQGAEEGSQTYRALAVAIEVANAAAAIGAILNQAQGDPYSAWVRMASMAAVVAAMGFNIANISGGGGSDPERTRQEDQGTGSVLGDAEEKTESILRASEITADATSELVGINRGMLNALQNLETGLGGASVQLARDAGNADFGEMPKGWDTRAIGEISGAAAGGFAGWVVGAIIGGPLGAALGTILGGFIGKFAGGILGKLLGGSSKVLDEGIRIVGGYLNDLSSEVMVQAWQQLKVKKSIFHSSNIQDRFEDMDDEVSTQFALVFKSIGDTVREAALALGIPLDVIEQRIAAFQIATMDISLMDLTAEEQREELLAVFGQIFDDLAADVVPFIEQFQLVGEGLGETLVRVATSVQVFREAINAFGFTIDTTDPELFAQIAVGIIEMTGGVENFIALFTTFFDKFASEEQKLEFVTSQLTRAFESVGLEIPPTRDGMIELMMSLDATTESGQRQIAMLLEIAGVADEYYSLVEDAEKDRLKMAQEVADAIAKQVALVKSQVELISDFTGAAGYAPLNALIKSFEEAMKAAKSLNATQREYAMITRAFDAQLKRMAAQLTLSVLSLMDQLFGPDGLTSPIEEGLERTREVANDVFTDWIRALEDIYEFTQELLLDENLTTLTPAEQFAEAQSQFDKILAAAMAGDAEAAAALPDAAQALLEEARFMFASGQQYTDIFNDVLNALNAIAMPSGIPETIIETLDSGEEKTEAQIIASALARELEKFLVAADLAMALRDLSQVLGVSVLSLAAELGVPLRELVEILGVDLDNLGETTAAALAGVAQMLGADIFELMVELGIGLRELAIASGVGIDNMSQDMVHELGEFAAALGVDVLDLTKRLDLSIADLAETFGLGIDQFSAEQFKALVEFSNALGAGVSDVAEALDINLGEIADATSVLSQAMDIAIAELPDDIQGELSPFLTAIRDATNEADANTAINNLGTYVLDLPPGIAASLLPFLELMGFHQIAPELAALFDIEKNTRDTVNAIKALGNYEAPPPKWGDDDGVDPIPDPIIDDGISPFATGGYVNETGMYQLHAGETVINRNATTANENLTANELSQIRSVLGDIRDQNRQYYQDDLKVGRGIESGVTQTAEQQRRMSSG